MNNLTPLSPVLSNPKDTEEVRKSLLNMMQQLNSQPNALTDDQQAALAGTSGTPSATNPYVTKLGANPFCIWNSESTINTNGVVSKTVVSDTSGAGATLLANTTATYYDIALPRALLPNETPVIQVRSKIDGTWIGIDVAASSACMILTNHYLSDLAPANHGLSIRKVQSGILRVFVGAYAGATGVSANLCSWATQIAASDGFDAWRVCCKG